ncbi:hypothetical protein GCM10022234_35960 [Aeromicrobium panaciterrae]|uniref:DUF6907 domain-containing protein n=1 Tax=Aeromicrobium panaciterrae TaxID=363861 RepID=UPI0031D5ECF0
MNQSIEIACPSWCETDHATDRGANRCGDVVHRRAIRNSPLGKILIEQMTVSDGQPIADEPVIYVPEDPNQGEMTSAEARSLASALVAAGNELDHIASAVQA